MAGVERIRSAGYAALGGVGGAVLRGVIFGCAVGAAFFVGAGSAYVTEILASIASNGFPEIFVYFDNMAVKVDSVFD